MGFLFESTTSNVVALAAIVVGLGYYYVNWKFNYWQRNGVKFLKPSIPFGNFKALFLQRISLGEHILDMYQKTTEPFIGLYNVMRPSLMIRDPVLLREVLIKEFASFQDRGGHSDESYDPLSGHLFALGGDKWKHLRAKLTPTFTSGKLKAMFSTIIDCSSALDKYVQQAADANRSIEIRELLAQYSTNIIASVAFGIEIDCIGNAEVPFRKYGRKFFDASLRNYVRFLFSILYPKLLSLLKIKAVDQDVEDFMLSVVQQNMEHREQNNVSRKDFFQLLLQLRNTGDVQVDGLWDTKITNDENLKKLSIKECAAQSFIFLLAGFETTSTTIAFAMYELSKNVDLQRKAQQEIDEVLRKHAGHITYESVSEMKYLDMIIDESLRMYSPAGMLNRECNTPWAIPNTNIVIEVGTQIIIPVHGLHYDPKYYPEPEKFIPERFSAENSKSLLERPYLPFGEGPRNCIGMRMGKMEAKIGMITLLQNYSFTLTGSSLKPIVMDTMSFVPAPVGGINLNVTKRKQ